MILPAVLHGHFYVAETANTETGFRAPVAVVTWAFVSEETDRRLRGDLVQHIRLRPNEWRNGEIGWIVDWTGDPHGIRAAVEWLNAGPFKDKVANILVRGASGTTTVATINDLLATSRTEGNAA